MLSCREMSEQASEILAGRAGWRTRLAAQLHTMMCNYCRRYYRQLRLTIATVQRARCTDSPRDTSRVVDAILRAIGR